MPSAHIPIVLTIKYSTIKYGKQITKLKLRKSKYLYTWKTDEMDKAKQLIRAIPKSKPLLPRLLTFSALEKIEIKKRQKMKRR